MLHSPIIPEHHRIRRPAKAALVFQGRSLATELRHQHIALVRRQILDMANEKVVHIEQLAPSLLMRAHHWMLHHRKLDAHLLLGFFVKLMPERLGIIVHGDHPVNAFFHLVRQTLIGGVHVAEKSVSASGGHLDGMKNRAHRRTLPPRHIAVPAVLVAGHISRLLKAHQLRKVFVAGNEGVDFQVAEPLGESHMLG